MSKSLRMRTALATAATAGLLLAGSATASAGELPAAAGTPAVVAASSTTTSEVTEIGGETPFFRDAFYCNLLPWLC